MATLKNMTRVGADVRQIARLLQAKAPENHMLAYITPEEAQLLRDRGGSGMPDPQTGVLSFAPVSEYYDTGNPVYDYGDEAYTTPVQPQTQIESVALPPASSYESQGVFSRPDYSSFMPPPVAAPQVRSVPEVYIGSPDRAALFGAQGYGTGSPPVEDRSTIAPPFQTESKTLGQRYDDLAKSLGIEKSTLTKGGSALLQLLYGAKEGKKAAQQGQRGRQEMEALAAPYLQKGAELQRQAQAGELTPVARQQLQAAQAQAAQAASARGGVGAQQTAARVEAIRNQLLQQQNDYGMKLTSIGDQIALGAIRTGLQADQYANQLTSSYFNNIMRTLSGTPTVTQTTQTTTTGG